MEYVTVQDKAKEWQVSERQVQYYCRQEKIKGAFKQSGVWLLPFDSEKPSALTTVNKPLRLLSLFSGCGGLDLGFEGHFEIFESQYNARVHPDWDVTKTRENRLLLPKTRFDTVFANDILPETQIAWSEFFDNKNHVYCLDHSCG